VADFGRAIWAFLLNDKSETYHRIVDFCAMIKNQVGGIIQRVRSDNGTEFTNEPLRDSFRKMGFYLRHYV